MDANGTLTVLAVTREGRSRASLEGCLGDDYRMLMAASVQHALQLMADEDIDLLLCDHRMPHVNAVELFRHTRISHPEAIRILITGDTDHKELIRSINEAAVYHIVPKPWQPDQVRSWLSERSIAGSSIAQFFPRPA